MEKEIITQKQAIAVMVTFTFGSTLVLGIGSEAKQDVWLAVLMAMIMSVPILFMYARLISIFPGRDLYDILIIIFGKVIGKIAALPFIWFSFHLGALVIRNFTEFISIVSLFNTPQYIIAFPMVLLCIWAIKEGIEVIGRWTAIILPVMILSILVVFFLFTPILNFKNIKPTLYEGLNPVLSTAYSLFSFPFAETVVFTFVLNSLKKNSSSYKVYFWSLSIGGAIILLVTTRNIVVLGAANVSILYFPTYSAVKLINIGDFLQRIEVFVSIVFLFGGFVKTCICLYGASVGFAKIFNFNNYRQIVAPMGLLMMILSLIIYTSAMEMFDWANKISKYYSIPFKIILPLIIFIAAEIKVRSKKDKIPS